MSKGWSDWVADDEAAARAGGRRRYNEVRRVRAQYRRIQVTERLLSDGWTYGAQARIAEELGVSDATISRDLKAIFPRAILCPVCACRHPLERWRELERQGRVKLGPGPSDDQGSPPGRDGDGDEHRKADSPRGTASRDEDLRRLKELTDQMREQNAYGVIEEEPVEADPSY